MSGLVPQVLIPGVRFSLKNRMHEVSFADAGSVRYSSCEGGRPYVMPTEIFWNLVDKADIGFLEKEDGAATDATSGYKLWQISEPQRIEMLRRFAYVRAALAKEKKPLSKKNLMAVIKNISEKSDDRFPPAASTLCRWIKRYVTADGSPRALVPQHDRKGARDKKFPLEIEGRIVRTIKEDFLTHERISVKQVYCNVIGAAKEEKIDGHEDLLPSSRTIYRRVQELDPYIAVLKRFGPKIADARFRAAGASIEVSRLMEVVMIDGHKIDVIVIEKETGSILGRAHLVCLFDVGTRTAVGWHISLLPFSATTALAAIKDMCSRDPQIMPGGVAESILPDNGRDLASNALRNLCSTVGMHLLPAKTYCPDDKAHLERFFRTVNQQLVHMISGTTFSSPTDRGEYDSSAHAKISLGDLKALFSQWIDTVYHRAIHTATHRAPLLAWRDQQAEMPIMWYSATEIDVIARVGYARSINGGRVIVDGLAYKSDALATLEGRHQRDVTVLVDELNLGFVYVRHHANPKILIRADGVRRSYTENLTKYEHDEVKKRLKALAQKDLKELGEYAYEIARWKLWCEIHKLSNSTSARKLKLLTNGSDRQKVASDKAAAMRRHEQQPPLSETLAADHTPSESPRAEPLLLPHSTSENDDVQKRKEITPATSENEVFDTFEI